MIEEKIDRIVELDIDDEQLTDDVFDGTGVEIVSIVDRPAIQADFLYFGEEGFITPNPCQEGYEAIGTKIKNGREVPNCVPIQNEEEFVEPMIGEGHDDYMERCIGVEIGEGKPQDQAVAICHSKWEAVHGPTEMEEHKFESYNDYPKAARENACRAVIHADEEGWGSCGTAVGKRRASQLCMGQNISRDTIARMAAFARHAQHKDVPYDEGCGGLMYDACGS